MKSFKEYLNEAKTNPRIKSLQTEVMKMLGKKYSIDDEFESDGIYRIVFDDSKYFDLGLKGNKVVIDMYDSANDKTSSKEVRYDSEDVVKTIKSM